MQGFAHREQPDDDDDDVDAVEQAGKPKASRGFPVRTSMPTRPMTMPRKRLVTPRTSDAPSSAEAAVKANTMSAKYSAGPKRSATRTKTARGRSAARVPMVPAMNEPIAAVASAAAPRPWRAMRLPSSEVMIDPILPAC